VFFMDVEGHAGEPPLDGCLERLRGEVEYLRVLGSYPAEG
jgi:prephenate dehydratase